MNLIAVIAFLVYVFSVYLVLLSGSQFQLAEKLSGRDDADAKTCRVTGMTLLSLGVAGIILETVYLIW